MHINEIITEEKVGTILTKDFQIEVDDHALERAKQRGVSPNLVDYIIRKQLPKVLPKLEKIETGQQFWVYDWSSETALGLRRISSTEPRFLLKTVFSGVPALTPNIQTIIKI